MYQQIISVPLAMVNHIAPRYSGGMTSLNQTYHINAPIQQVWACLVEPALIDEWGGGPVTMSDQVGAKFSLWGGDICGTNTKVEAPNLLKQDWQEKDWAVPSRVTFELAGHGEKTTLRLHHTGFPADRHEDLAAGWHEYYLGPIKELLESQN